ncbi:hypothetical protein DERF_005841 [Dermatophagoides farinae]|uniref:Uncharacterized protein n=1 Tax=Dermatophagoides farinae TaxID=6954 RepID=A0A922I6M8_DERFA|nr:hypothetical protein HUG17_3237 [Dermatophagoides farinae]KAH9522253.1 hypothetical protein DERF_005841 [Dermatophagoides farinae]
MIEQLKFYHTFKQLLCPSNHQWWTNELYLLWSLAIRFTILSIITFMDESVLKKYCHYDTIAAFLFNYENLQHFNIIQCRMISIIMLIFIIFIIHSELSIYFSDHKTITWKSLYDISNQNYDHYLYCRFKSTSPSRSSTLKRIAAYHRWHSNLIGFLLNGRNYCYRKINEQIDLTKFKQTKLTIFKYANVEQRIPLILVMKIAEFMSVFVPILAFVSVFIPGLFFYLQFIIMKHMSNLWPIALFDAICFLYFSHIIMRNMILYFNFSSLNTVFYRTRMKFLKQKLQRIITDQQKKSQQNCLYYFYLKKFQREHQHMTSCLMIGGLDVWNSVFLMGLICNIPLNVLVNYQLFFGNNSSRTQLTYFGFVSIQSMIFGTILSITSTINSHFHTFKHHLPSLQIHIKPLTLKWQILEFYERLINYYGAEFGWYIGKIAVINFINSVQILFTYLSIMLIMFKFFFKNNIKF